MNNIPSGFRNRKKSPIQVMVAHIRKYKKILFYSSIQIFSSLPLSPGPCRMPVLQALDYEEEKMGSAANHFSGTQMAGQLEDVRNKKTANIFVPVNIFCVHISDGFCTADCNLF